MANNYQKFIYGFLRDKPIVFYPSIAKMLGGRAIAIFFNQIIYWTGKGKDPEWIYKTIKEFEEETTLTRFEQDKAIEKLKKLNVLEVKLKGVPAKRHFRINRNKLTKLIEKFYNGYVAEKFK